jgi:hypothetical protein
LALRHPKLIWIAFLLVVVSTPCQAGYYQASTGQSLCASCAPGSANEATGSYSCALCRPGTFTSAFKQQFCAACPVGRHSEKGGALGSSTCVDCEVILPSAWLLFRSKQGLTLFAVSLCLQPGRYARTPGLAECVQCELGSFSDSNGASVCSQCSPVRHLSLVAAGKAFFTSPSDFFAQGSAVQRRGASRCDACLAGTAVAVAGSIVCRSCLVRALAVDLPANTQTFSCRLELSWRIPARLSARLALLGAISRSPASRSACRACQGAKSISPCCRIPSHVRRACRTGASSPGSAQCVPCAVGRYTNESGTATCEPCPTGKATNV